jgi:enoyl-[acyl-carrier protein] reductase/trans-2-enoyl-CoA reductase (NAD+)
MLFQEMKKTGTHEGCIEQLYRLFTECLYSDTPRLDEEGRLRVDELELDPAIQDAVSESWAAISNETLADLTDLDGYKKEFLNLFGFEIDGVDYDADVNPDVAISNMV